MVDLKDVDFFDALYDTAKWLLELLDKAETTQVIESEEPAWLIKHRQIFQSCEALRDRSQLEESEISSTGMKLALGILSGKLKYLAVTVSQPHDRAETTGLTKSIVGVFQTHLPEDRTVFISDATNSAEGLEELIGRPVKDMTPQGRLERQSSVVQVATDIKRKTAFSTFVKLLAGIMVRHPQSKRIGVIGLRPHIQDLRGILETSCFGSRILKTCYFREGPDRASNDWHTQCDLLIVLGTPRVSNEAIVNELIRRGRLKEALEDGKWGPRRWEAETVTADRRVVDGLGYANPSWRRVHSELVKSALLQAVGRARPYIEGGIPAVVCSTEPLGLPVEDKTQQKVKLSRRAQKVWQWLERDIAKTLKNINYTFGNFKTSEASRRLQMSLPQTSKALKQLAEIGYLTQPCHGCWQVTHLALENSAARLDTPITEQ